MSLSNNPIFSLDIGTRSVVGILLESDGDHHYNVIGMEKEEHQERSMLDGQIHDVVAVASTVKRVKEKLESKFGPLENVAVAAAGRALITRKVKLDHDITGHPPMIQEQILALELSAVQQAQAELAQSRNEEDKTQYYCVGYSVVQFLLDHSPIGNLIDQRGEVASVEIIATFLPRIVVDNLLASLKRANLTMSALTLEPIAAIHVLIPATMRRLNIALVDIGAGTSDIAITEGGTITAYGMVPVAGDEITDALMQTYLLDFPDAEKVKRDLNEKENIIFTDILGLKQQLSRTEMIHGIREEVMRLAKTIAERIIELNGKTPQAVILIGGGSLTPGIGPALAHVLGISEQRVAVRGVDAIQNLTNKNKRLRGPEMVTPVGIAVAAREHPVKYLSIQVNQQPYRFFDLREISVGEALIACGMDIKRLYGRPGLATTVKVNNRIKMFPGTHGTPPQITVNGKPAALDTIVTNDDMIEVIAGTNGESSTIKLIEVLDEVTTMDLTINGNPYSFSPIPKVNGEVADWERVLVERDEVEIHLPKNLFDLKDEIGLTLPLQKTIHYSINGEQKQYKQFETIIEINNRPSNLYSPLQYGDVITFKQVEHPLASIGELLPVDEMHGLSLRVYFNDELIHIPTTSMKLLVNGEQANPEIPLTDGAVITFEHQPMPTPTFADLFRFVDYQVPTFTSGVKVLVLRNEELTTLDQPLSDGDVLEIRSEHKEV